MKGFNSLQTGKCIASAGPTTPPLAPSTPFQFPSNGKVYSKLLRTSNWANKSGWFQFPSNGKVYSKATDALHPVKWGRAEFQFPSNGKVYSKLFLTSVSLNGLSFRFNSLQTGKCIASNWKFSRLLLRWKSFNSLQTGKCIASCFQSQNGCSAKIWFQFPSNGKVYSKSY